MLTLTGKYTSAKVMLDQLDPATESQIIQFINNQAFTQPCAIMPDTHVGSGAVIGFTMPLGDKLIPNTIGVDIGCGMLMQIYDSWHSGLGTDSRNAAIDSAVRASIPFGKAVRTSEFSSISVLDFNSLTRRAAQMTQKLREDLNLPDLVSPTYSETWFHDFCRRLRLDGGYAIASLGTLGGGNHFIELGRLSTGQITATVHSGSRYLGKKVCEYWQNLAADGKPPMSLREWIAKVKETFPKSQWEKQIGSYSALAKGCSGQPRGLEFLTGAEMHGYLVDMLFAQEYASQNRKRIGQDLSKIFGQIPVDEIETVHNYIDFTDYVLRKGAVRAHTSDRLAIPLSMADGILLCRGKSNPEWNWSAPHGAGRICSRSAINAQFQSGELTQALLEESMAGVYVAGIPADESLFAYKSASLIIASIFPTAEILDQAKPFLAMKCLDGAQRIDRCPVAQTDSPVVR